MKNLFFILVLAVGLMSFTSANEVNRDLTINKKTVLLNVNNVNEDAWVCCTVSNSSSQVTVCRPDGNLRKACNRARRLLEQIQ